MRTVHLDELRSHLFAEELDEESLSVGWRLQLGDVFEIHPYHKPLSVPCDAPAIVSHFGISVLACLPLATNILHPVFVRRCLVQ